MKRPWQQNVLIIQAVMKQYRVPFFDKLYHALRHEGIGLKVAYGGPLEGELKKKDNVDIGGRYGVKVSNRWLLGGRLLYQPVIREVHGADLVIIDQANKHIVNYLLLLLSALGSKRVAFWGHGYNRQARRPGISEFVKRKLCGKVDWWFAYTRGTAAYLASQGVAPDNITCVQNSIDTIGFQKDLSGVSDTVIRAERCNLGIGDKARIGLFCGSLYSDKHIGFLLDSAVMIKRRVPDFELLLVGGGPDSGLAEKAAREYRWVHYAGPIFGLRKAVYFRMAELFIHPGALGLAILDAFAAGLPVLTTDNQAHGPEIEYLEDGVNGIISPFDVQAFSGMAAGLLADGESRGRLMKGAAASTARYNIDVMVGNFRQGIVECLALEPSPRRARCIMGRHTSA